jgi:hypothetical protein
LIFQLESIKIFRFIRCESENQSASVYLCTSIKVIRRIVTVIVFYLGRPLTWSISSLIFKILTIFFDKVTKVSGRVNIGSVRLDHKPFNLEIVPFTMRSSIMSMIIISGILVFNIEFNEFPFEIITHSFQFIHTIGIGTIWMMTFKHSPTFAISVSLCLVIKLTIWTFQCPS